MTTKETCMHLTEDQKKKLKNRSNLTTIERRDNEFAVRNRMREFLKFIPDANFILESLPRDQLNKNKKLTDVMNDRTIQGLLELTEKLLDLLDYMPVQGSPGKPYVTKILSEKLGDVIVRQATELDFARNQQLINHIGSLANYYQTDAPLWMNLALFRERKK